MNHQRAVEWDKCPGHLEAMRKALQDGLLQEAASGGWVATNSLLCSTYGPDSYRRGPEPKYRAYTLIELLQVVATDGGTLIHQEQSGLECEMVHTDLENRVQLRFLELRHDPTRGPIWVTLQQLFMLYHWDDDEVMGIRLQDGPVEPTPEPPPAQFVTREQFCASVRLVRQLVGENGDGDSWDRITTRLDALLASVEAGE